MVTTLLRARQKNLRIGGQVTDFKLIGLGRIAATSMYQLFTPPWISMPRLTFCADTMAPLRSSSVQPQHGVRGVPVLIHGHPCAVHAPPVQLPIGVQPERIADHDHQSVLGTAPPVAVGFAGERSLICASFSLILISRPSAFPRSEASLASPLLALALWFTRRVEWFDRACFSNALTNSSLRIGAPTLGTFCFLARLARSLTVSRFKISSGHRHIPITSPLLYMTFVYMTF